MIPNHILIHDIMQQGDDVRNQAISCFIAAGLSPSFCVDMIKQPDGSTWIVQLSAGEAETSQVKSILDTLNAAITNPSMGDTPNDAA